MKRFLAILGFSLALAGCSTSLETRPVSMTQDRIDGVPYALPVLRLETRVTHRLTACSVVKRGEEGFNPDLAFNDVHLVVDFESVVENKAEYPAGEYFVLDYSALAAATKTSSFKVTFHENRMLSAINVSADDATVDIAVAGIRAGVSIASLAAGVPVPLGAQGSIPDPAFACPTGRRALATRGANNAVQYEVVPLVDLRKAVATERKNAVEALADANASLEALTARNAGTLSDADRQRITTLTDLGKELRDKIKGFDRQIATYDETLAYTETVHWQPPSVLPASRILLDGHPFSASDAHDMARGAARDRWISGMFNQQRLPDFRRQFGSLEPQACSNDDCIDGAPGRVIARRLSLNLRLQADDALVTPADARGIAGRLGISSAAYNPANENAYLSDDVSRDYVAGVVARQPVRGQFIVCTGFAIPCTESAASKVLDTMVSVPQLGPYVVLPFANGVGQNNALNATFAQTGEPTMVEYKENSAAALEVAQGIATGANAVNGFMQALDGQSDANREEALAAPLQQLQRQAAVLQQQQVIANLQEQLLPTNPLTLLQRQVALMEQQSRLATLEAARNPDVIAYQDAADQLRRDLELLKLQVQIAQQEALLAP